MSGLTNVKIKNWREVTDGDREKICCHEDVFHTLSEIYGCATWSVSKT